jgi:transcriptional regulator with XRE-family HTH domain
MPKNEMSPLGKRLKELREAAGLTQQDVAFRSGLSISIVSQIEQGLKDPRVSTVKALATALGVDAGALIDGQEKAEAQPSAPKRSRGRPRARKE